MRSCIFVADFTYLIIVIIDGRSKSHLDLLLNRKRKVMSSAQDLAHLPSTFVACESER